MLGCDVVFHCAADYRMFAPDPRELYRNNDYGTLTVSADGVPATEASTGSLEHMAGDYKRSKFLAEREVVRWFRRGLPVVTVCPSTPVGERDARPTPTGQIIVDFLNGRMPAYV